MTLRYAFGLCFLVLAGCTKQSDRTEQATASPASASAESMLKPASFNTSGAPTVEFSVPDMMCPDGCGLKVKEILSEQPGAKEVMVDFDSKTATVAVEEGKFESDKAVAALVDHSFNNSKLNSDPAAGGQVTPAPAQPVVTQ